MKKKWLRMGLALAALLVAIGFLGCPDDNGGGNPRTPNSGATLNWVTIGGVTAAEPEEGTDLESVLDDSNYMRGYQEEIELTAALANAQISYELAGGSGTGSSLYAKVEFAQVSKTTWSNSSFDPEDNADIEGDLSIAVTGRTFADEDWLVVKVTSEDKSKVQYYRANVTLGRNARLASLTIGSAPKKSDKSLGKPAEDFASFDFAATPAAGKGTKGTFQTDPLITTSKFIPVPVDTGAAVGYAFVEEATPTALPGAFTAITDFTNGVLVSTLSLDQEKIYHLYIEIEPTSPLGTTLYYIMRVAFGKGGVIAYGVPKLVDPTAPGNSFYIDPIWDEVDWDFVIDRSNSAEYPDATGYFHQDYGRHTSAKAKALWDDGGIWVLVDADVKAFSTTQGGASVDRLITPGSDHVADSVEVFINERLQVLEDVDSNDWGNQFRVGVNNARSGETAAAVSADDIEKGMAADAKPSLAPFTDATYAKSRTALKDSSDNLVGELEDATNGGYKVIAYVPFKLQGSANASNVWQSNSIKEGATIGFELQLNCNPGGGLGRSGVLTWNGVNEIAYQNARGYGLVTLTRTRNGTVQPVANTTSPAITAQALSDEQYIVGTSAADVNNLSVTAGGTIQWYEADSPYGDGTAIATGGTSSTYKPDASAAGTTYYYAIVTQSGVSVATNRRAKIEVADASAFAEKWTILNPKLTAGWTTPAADGSVTVAAGGGTLFGYTFPVGNFSSVEITVEGTVSSGDGSVPLKFVSKQYNADGSGPHNTSGDCTTHQYPDITVPASGSNFTYTFNYPISYDSTLTGDQPSAYRGGIAWQTNNNTVGVDNFKITKAVFTVKDSNDGSFYLNLHDLPAAQADQSGQWYMGVGSSSKGASGLPEATFNAAGHLIWTFDNDTDETGNGARQRAIINLNSQQVAKANAKVKWDIEIGGSVDTATKGTPSLTWFLGKAALAASDWNVHAGTALNLATSPQTATDVTPNGNHDGTNFESFMIRQANAACVVDVTIEYIKITPKD